MDTGGNFERTEIESKGIANLEISPESHSQRHANDKYLVLWWRHLLFLQYISQVISALFIIQNAKYKTKDTLMFRYLDYSTESSLYIIHGR